MRGLGWFSCIFMYAAKLTSKVLRLSACYSRTRAAFYDVVLLPAPPSSSRCSLRPGCCVRIQAELLF